MKNLFKFGIIFLFLLTLLGCRLEQGSEDLSFYLLGEDYMTIKQDRVFVDPGFVAEHKNVELTQDVTIQGTIDSKIIGEQVVQYLLNINDEEHLLSRTVNVVPALSKDMAFDFFSNVDISVLEFFPDSFREPISTDSISTNSNCIINNNNKFTFGEDEYDYCMTSLDNNSPMSDSYIDIYTSLEQFEIIEKYTNTILHSMDTVSNATMIDEASVMTPYGEVSMSITDEILDDSITFTGNFQYSSSIDLELEINAQLTYNQDTDIFKVRYAYDITIGYSFLGFKVYNMYAEAHIDSDYNLVKMDIYNNVPFTYTKATSLNIVDNTNAEMLSYFSVVGLFESKAYIYTENNYGYAYKINDALGMKPKEYFDVFTEETKVFSYEIKEEHEESKFYLPGLLGWKEAYYLIDVIGPNNKLDGVVVLNDDLTLIYKEEIFDDDESSGITLSKEDSKFYYYDEEEEDILEYIYETEVLFIYQNNSKGAISAFDPPMELELILDIDIENIFNETQVSLLDYEVFGIILFNVSGFGFEIPLLIE